MKLLITGGLGFIGKHLAARLAQDPENEIVVVDKLSEQVHGPNPDHADILNLKNVTFVRADICEPNVLREAMTGVDVIFHLAAETGTGQSMYAIVDYFRTNVLGTAKLLEEMVRSPETRPKRLVLASSRSVYGEGAYVRTSDVQKQDATRFYPGARDADDMRAGNFDFSINGEALAPVPTRETDPTDPRSLYAVSKLTQEQMCEVACRSVGVDFTALRFQNVYGPGQSLRNPYTGIISIFTNILRQNETVDIFEDGEETRDFVFVGDIVTALCAAYQQPSEDTVINVGTGIPLSVSELVRLLSAKLGVAGKHVISGRFRQGDIRHNFADVERMHRLLAGHALTSVEEGLSRTVDWALTQPTEKDRSEEANRELTRFLGK